MEDSGTDGLNLPVLLLASRLEAFLLDLGSPGWGHPKQLLAETTEHQLDQRDSDD